MGREVGGDFTDICGVGFRILAMTVIRSSGKMTLEVLERRQSLEVLLEKEM